MPSVFWKCLLRGVEEAVAKSPEEEEAIVGLATMDCCSPRGEEERGLSHIVTKAIG